MYTYVKNVPVQVKLRPFCTLQQLVTSNDVYIHNDEDNGAYHIQLLWWNYVFFDQNKKVDTEK